MKLFVVDMFEIAVRIEWVLFSSLYFGCFSINVKLVSFELKLLYHNVEKLTTQ